MSAGDVLGMPVSAREANWDCWSWSEKGRRAAEVGRGWERGRYRGARTWGRISNLRKARSE
eukprot:182568-Pyramimonas_sp.AAC.1